MNHHVLCLPIGASEENLMACGAVILSPRHAKVIVFLFQVPREIVSVWKVMCSFEIALGHFFREGNGGAKEALVRGVTKSFCF